MVEQRGRLLQGNTLTLDALTARANTGSVHVGADTTIILDEAGMVDHKRLDALTDLAERSGAKLTAVRDGKQLPSIGPGGMFDRLAYAQHVYRQQGATVDRAVVLTGGWQTSTYRTYRPSAKTQNPA